MVSWASCRPCPTRFGIRHDVGRESVSAAEVAAGVVEGVAVATGADDRAAATDVDPGPTAAGVLAQATRASDDVKSEKR